MTSPTDLPSLPEPDMEITTDQPVKIHSLQQIQAYALAAYRAGRLAGLEEAANRVPLLPDKQAIRRLKDRV